MPHVPEGSGQGIVTLQLTGDGLARTDCPPVAAGENPTYIAVHPDEPVIYAVNEADEEKVIGWKYTSSVMTRST